MEWNTLICTRRSSSVTLRIRNFLPFTFTNVWMIFNYFCGINSGWPIQVMGDGTFNFCNRPIALLGLGIMGPGGKLQLLLFSFAPTESADAYKFAWTSFEKSAISFASNFMTCARFPSDECAVRNNISIVLTHETTRESLILNILQPSRNRKEHIERDSKIPTTTNCFTKF